MTVIAMTQEAGTRGSEVAAALAQRLGIASVSHDLAERVADKLNMKKSMLQRLREGKASMLERLATPQAGVAVFTAEEVYALAQKGDILIRGWGSTLLLRPVAHIPCVRICAPMEDRVRSLMARLDTDDEAFIRDEIRKSDDAHAAAMQSRFGVRWGDPLLYDLTLNTERVAIDSCVEQIVALADRPEFRETPQSRAQLDALALQARVRSALFADARTSDVQITLTAAGGQLRLRGIVADDAERRACAEVANRVPGVTELINELKVMRRNAGAPRD